MTPPGKFAEPREDPPLPTSGPTEANRDDLFQQGGYAAISMAIFFRRRAFIVEVEASAAVFARTASPSHAFSPHASYLLVKIVGHRGDLAAYSSG